MLPVRQRVVILPEYSYVAVSDELMPRLRNLVAADAMHLRLVPSANGEVPRYTLAPVVGVRRRREPGELTDREVSVLRMFAVGMQTHEIAEQMSVTQDTVKTHILHTFQKLGARSRAHAVHLAYQRGILTAGGA